MSNFSIICVHPLASCLDQYRKVLKKDEYYFFNKWYELRDGKLIKNNRVEFERSFFSESISIQAIVGKNGSGKSSILDLLYRLINNLSYVAVEGMYRGGADRLYFIRNLNAEFFYELDDVLGSVRSENDRVYFKYGEEIEEEYHFAEVPDEDEEAINHVDNKRRKISIASDIDERAQDILEHFFYSLILNYSIQSLVPQDYGTELSCGDDKDDNPENSWLDPIYDKNDGYLVPWGIEPYKGHNMIDLSVQKDLSDSRISVLLIDAQRRSTLERTSIEFIPGYQLDDIVFRMKNTRPDKNDDEACSDRKFLESVIDEPLSERCSTFISGYSIMVSDEVMKSELYRELMVYIMEKTFHILETYPSYKNYRHIRDIFFSVEVGEDDFIGDYPTMLSDAIDQIWNDPSHISTKIRQAVRLARALDFPKNVKLFIHGQFSYSEFIKKFYGKEVTDFESPSEILEYYVPSIFDQEIHLRKTEDNKSFKLADLSSGERQFAVTSAAYLYHIRNILSVPRKNGNRIAYRHINLFLDEIELCYHPDFQRTFIYNLIKSLKDNGILEECHINVLLTTHSPFVLSDIPKSNILFLRDGSIANDEIKYDTFGSNINDLLFKGFFLENGFSGALSQKKINNVAEQLSSGKKVRNIDSVLRTIEIVGDPLIKYQLKLLYDEYLGKHEEERKNKRIEELKTELKTLGGI